MSDGGHILKLDKAFRAGDLAALRELLGNRADFPYCCIPDRSGGGWLLEYAIYWSPLSFVATLIDGGAETNYRDEAGFPCLIAAIYTARPAKPALLHLLLGKGANVEQRGFNDWTPLHYAVALRDLQSLRQLLEYDADCRARTRIDDCTTALEDARIAGFAAAVRLLVSQ